MKIDMTLLNSGNCTHNVALMKNRAKADLRHSGLFFGVLGAGLLLLSVLLIFYVNLWHFNYKMNSDIGA